MNLIPMPKNIINNEGHFSIDFNTSIKCQLDKASHNVADQLVNFVDSKLSIKLKKSSNAEGVIDLIVDDIEELYRIEVGKEKISLIGKDIKGVFYASQTLKQLIVEYGRHIPACIISDKPDFGDRGFYHDVTRGKVPKLERLKEIADTCAYYKLNQLQLYIEHTFLFSGQSEVWSVTDPLSADEIIEFDQYCQDRYIELVPSISTFGHLYELLQTESYKHLSELDRFDYFSFEDRMSHHTLNVSLEESFEVVKRMIDDFMPLVSSNRFNICADETFDLGEGKNADLAKKLGKSKLYVDFLIKIVDYVKSHNKEVMFWGDIIIKHPEHIKDLPKDLICLNWWYWLDYPEEKVKIIDENGFRQFMCPGVNGWNTLMNNHQMAYDNVRLMTDYANKYKVQGILNTDWGDYGHMNDFSGSIPGLIYGASFAWGDHRSYNDLNKAIDLIEFNNLGIMSIIDEISRLHFCNLTAVVHYFEKKKRVYLDRIDVSYDKLLYAEKRLDSLYEDLLDKYVLASDNIKGHLRAYLLACKGIKYLNRLYMVIKVEEDKVDWSLDFKYSDLASDIEYWLLDFKKKWYIDNKPSEIYRIVNFFKDVNIWLRRLK
ncbi:family 20 glycosylhydrolase [Acidaminobacter sp. JC074]|uniref:beta-N-acetylhexosaminidase n=1 Tax=Acidaminobacter sp. JC074 TaxID=2530199 RepID=UPI001F0F4842|nr:family 20 glycosylhydrolase [Acidaminobacter sp. JC074]